MIQHPEVAFRDCRACHVWLYDERTGEREFDTAGDPIARPAGTRPPCRWPGQSCPKGSPEQSKGLSPKNEQAYQHYLICKATARWPDDPIVARNAGIIRAVEDQLDRERSEAIAELLNSLERPSQCLE